MKDEELGFQVSVVCVKPIQVAPSGAGCHCDLFEQNKLTVSAPTASEDPLAVAKIGLTPFKPYT